MSKEHDILIPNISYPATLQASNLEDNPTCRICYGGPNIGRLLKPCKCKGTIEYVHGRCLELWLETTEHKKCELCHYLFKTRKVQKSCLEWFVHPVTENYRTKRMEYILAFASFTSSVIVLIWLIWRFLYRILFNSVQEYKLTLHFVSAVILLASILTYALLYIIWTIWCIRTYIHLIEDWRNSQGEVVDMESIELPSITSEDESVAQQDVLTREEV
ncbi:E3 ubiquitin-protein ligase MARCHF3-like isoform X2 [Parasteatoda tepidariorum]|uniref:E3 ubiquitin-protein ligase MARCHF3-like isoform X2 n=1 Tax=Parasteatoda tepidariorum TaxID=114398 RepID=UPI001C71E283|nr:E3 ubiquitin-protein ligase MARCHF3-like isoform X2 [Parasteatoda tepidariorum]